MQDAQKSKRKFIKIDEMQKEIDKQQGHPYNKHIGKQFRKNI